MIMSIMTKSKFCIKQKIVSLKHLGYWSEFTATKQGFTVWPKVLSVFGVGPFAPTHIEMESNVTW